jgi:hypothetical protein
MALSMKVLCIQPQLNTQTKDQGHNNVLFGVGCHIPQTAAMDVLSNGRMMTSRGIPK